MKTAFLLIGLSTFLSSSVFAGPQINLSGISDEQEIAILQQQLAAHPNDPKLLLDLANTQSGARQYDAARKTAEQAAKGTPADPEYLHRLGALFSFLGRTDAAITQLERAIKLKTNYADAHFSLAVIYATSQPPNRALARTFYARALELGSEPDPEMDKLLK